MMNKWVHMSLEIRDPLSKYVRLTLNGQRVERFACPVEGCVFTTKLVLGPSGCTCCSRPIRRRRVDTAATTKSTAEPMRKNSD